MEQFKYEGYNFRMDRRHTDDFSDATKGAIQVDVNGEWITMIAYEGFEENETLSLTNRGGKTEHYTAKDNFYFGEKDVIAFLKRNVPSVKDWIKRNVI